MPVAEAFFDSGKHPRGRAGKFVHGFAHIDPTALHSEWADLDRRLLPFVESNDTRNPAAEQMISRQKEITRLLHAQDHVGGMASPGLGRVHDVAVVGAGPAGLSASIYGATEGLDTVMLDASRKPGGQIGFTSRMENTLGFPAGITGAQYAQQGLDQAQRVGAGTLFGHKVTKMDVDPASRVKTLHMDDGTVVRAHAVVIAGGVQFRHLTQPGGEAPGVCYGDANALVDECKGSEAVVVGGANSAGQGAIKAAQSAKHVTILLRSGQLSDKMSDYLVQQIRATPNITVVHGEIARVNTDESGHVAGVTLNDGKKIACRGVGVYIGSSPKADWASGVERDATGSIRTGANPARSLETNVPGVFAAGDVRVGSVKRVVTAAGDGAAAISQVHPFLAGLRATEVREALDAPPTAYESDGTDQWMAMMDMLDSITDSDVDEDGSGDLLESIAEWEKARHHGDKAGPMPGGAHLSPGRGPHGELRNFKSMSAHKLAHTMRMLAVHGEDPHAHRETMKVAADKLGVKFKANTIEVPRHLAIKEHSALREFWLDVVGSIEHPNVLCECGAPARGPVCQRGHRLEEWGPAAWAASAQARRERALGGIAGRVGELERKGGFTGAAVKVGVHAGKATVGSAAAGVVKHIDPTGLSDPLIDALASHEKRKEEKAQGFGGDVKGSRKASLHLDRESKAALPVDTIRHAVQGDVKQLKVGEAKTYDGPEGPIKVTHTGRRGLLHTFKVEGGGQHVDPTNRRGTRQLVGHKDTATEVAERLHHSARADVEHTNMLTSQLRALKPGQVTHISSLNGPSATVMRHPWTGRLVVQHVGKGVPEHEFEHESDAIGFVKQGIRQQGGKFFEEGHGSDPLESQDPVEVGKKEVAARTTNPEKLSNLGDQAVDVMAPEPLSDSAKDWVKERVSSAVDAVVGSGGAEHAHNAAQAGGAMHASVGVHAHHVAAITDHLMAVLPHLHHLTTLVSATIDTAERDLQEAQRDGDGLRIVKARARLQAARDQLRDLESQIDAANITM